MTWLKSLDLKKLQMRSSDSRWGAGDPYRDRLLYCDAEYWYKVWDPKYIQALPIAIGERFLRRSSQNNTLPGFDLGVFNEDVASAFVDFIIDDNENLCGYVTKRGEPPSVIAHSFAQMFAERCINAGWIYSDFCHNNMIDINGKISLIDFDSHFTKLADLSIPFEKEKGCLREHVHSVFRDIIEREVMMGDVRNGGEGLK